LLAILSFWAVSPRSRKGVRNRCWPSSLSGQSLREPIEDEPAIRASPTHGPPQSRYSTLEAQFRPPGLTPDEVAPVVYVDPPPEFAAGSTPIPPTRPGRDELRDRAGGVRPRILERTRTPPEPGAPGRRALTRVCPTPESGSAADEPGSRGDDVRAIPRSGHRIRPVFAPASPAGDSARRRDSTWIRGGIARLRRLVGGLRGENLSFGRRFFVR